MTCTWACPPPIKTRCCCLGDAKLVGGEVEVEVVEEDWRLEDDWECILFECWEGNERDDL